MAELLTPIKMLAMLKPIKKKQILTVKKQTSESYMSQGLELQTHSMEADYKPPNSRKNHCLNTPQRQQWEIITNAYKGTRVQDQACHTRAKVQAQDMWNKSRPPGGPCDVTGKSSTIIKTEERITGAPTHRRKALKEGYQVQKELLDGLRGSVRHGEHLDFALDIMAPLIKTTPGRKGKYDTSFIQVEMTGVS